MGSESLKNGTGSDEARLVEALANEYVNRERQKFLAVLWTDVAKAFKEGYYAASLVKLAEIRYAEAQED